MSAIHSGPRTIENPLIQDKATFLETATDTNGASTLIQVELAPGGGNGLHYHKTFDETFTVLEGSLGVQIGKKINILNKGESATVPAGATHRFFNNSDQERAVFNVLLQPGNQGFEQTLQVVYGLAVDGHTTATGMPKNLYHFALIVHWSDTNIPGIFKLLEPVFRWLARRAVKKGIDQELIARYCIF